MKSNYTTTALLAFSLAVSLPIYWYFEFGLFFERMFFPPPTDVLRIGDFMTVAMQALWISLLVSCRALFQQELQHKVTRFALSALTLASIIASAFFIVMRAVEVFSETPPTLDVLQLVGVVWFGLHCVIFAFIVLFGLSLQLLERNIAKQLKLTGLFFILSVVTPFVTLGMLLPVAVILFAIALGNLAFYCWSSRHGVDLV